jgi:predicted RecA/RadA family phage recombinase
MATNYRQPGHAIDVTAPADVQSNDFVVVGDLFGVAAHDAKSGSPLVLYVGGVWTFGGLTGGAGTGVYHDGSSLTTSNGGGSNTKAGVLVADGEVRLNSSF